MSALLTQTWQTLSAHKIKSLLAILAIAWGVIAVVVLIALGEGFYRQQSQMFSQLADETQTVFPGRTSKSWNGLPSGRDMHFQESALKQLSKAAYVERLAVVYDQWEASISNMQGHQLTHMLVGVDEAYFPLSYLKLQPGSRNFSPLDQAHHRRVAIIGETVAMIGGVGLGEFVKVSGIPFKVVGILSREDATQSFGAQRMVMIPRSTYLDIWSGSPSRVLVKPIPQISAGQLRQQLLNFFSHSMKFDPTDHDALHMPDYSDNVATIKGILRAIQAFLGISGAMTLAVGALGVANIMFLSVTERTREIGVRLAIGATQSAILIQFLFEGLILVLTGALVGLLFSFGAVNLLEVNHSLLPEWIGIPVITPDSVALSSGVVIGMALLAAYFPARKASSLTPVIALSSRG
ncbi:ABC transporter permease [Vibrio nigripulchritudo]|uniref:ABC transporter permease n=1 Tax=Vibrio nigripulchritudo TaxID=28173 RepID=UPI0005FA69F4|nr:ABC transporter permease [Vibrio nigripulchritudo]KJY75216.1 ABC transporter substrate-binding protein [Vibrio nigripulchritudo]